jgi:hypothetical protein
MMISILSKYPLPSRSSFSNTALICWVMVTTLSTLKKLFDQSIRVT